MIPDRLGPYRIVSELGAGGMGRVYLAEAPEGRRRALKVIHPNLLESPGYFKRFQREADLGRRVVHENVVRTFGADEIEGHRFLVLEYVEGKTLRGLLSELGTVPETLLREIALQISAGLQAIHENGIVHRDLKPENVLITKDYEIRVMDLGVAKLQRASVAITEEGQFAGSVLYAAPEQFGPEEVDAAADLYALGVLLQELATGENPFRRDDAAAVIQAHLELRPPRIRDLEPDVTEFFSELVAQLLAKLPTERFASAAALHAVLERGERSPWWIGLEPLLRERVRRLPRIRVRRETNLHGRAADLATLRAYYDRAAAGDGTTVYVEGEAGIGKTRLVDAFLRELDEMEDVHVLYGSYPPSGGLGGLSDAILGKFGEVRLADELAPYLTVTPSLVPAFAALIRHESPPTGAEPLPGDAFQAVVVHLMRALAAEKPTLWVVEDLQFTTQESRDFLTAMARAVEDHRVLLIATARPGTTVAELSRVESFRKMTLTRLGARDIVRLLADAFHSDVLAERLAGKIAVKSDGVPFFVFEMIRGLREGQFIERLPDGSYVQTQRITEIEVPSAVKDLIGGRMRGLSRDQRAILDVGAVCGMTFDPGMVAHVLEEKRVRVLRELAEIERRFGLVRDEGEALRFDHNQIQEVIYLDLTPHLRTEYHTLLAEAYAERCDEKPQDDDAYLLAHHYLRGARPALALPHLEAAFDHLEGSYRNDTLLELADRALRVAGLLTDPKRAEILLRQAGRLVLLGRRDELAAVLDEALTVADRTGIASLRGRVRRLLGSHFARTAAHEASHPLLLEALEIAQEEGDRRLEAQTTGSLGIACSNIGGYAEAIQFHERARDLWIEVGDRRGESQAIGNLGNVLSNLGRYEEAQECHESARALFEEAGLRRDEAICIGNLGVALVNLGRYAQAQECYKRQLEISREIGARRGEATATANRGTVLMYQGRYAEAAAHQKRARTLFRDIGNRIGETSATANLADLAHRIGRYPEARERYEFCVLDNRDAGDRRGEATALQGLGLIAEAQGDAAEARRLHAEALALRRALGTEGDIASSLIALGRLEADPSRLDEALALAEKTKSPVQFLAATIEKARLPRGDVAVALAALKEHEERAEIDVRMRARFCLWELTRDEAHLEEAHRLVEHARDHAPEDDRDSMVEAVPLHRDIVKAWHDRD